MTQPAEVGPASRRPALPFHEARSLKRELLAELRAPWQDAAPVRPQDLLQRWPSEPRGDTDVASLLFEDYLRRAERGEAPDVEEYEQRCPGHGSSLAGLLLHQDLLRSLGTSNESA